MSAIGNYYFYIVNRFDSLIYEHELPKASVDKKVFLIERNF